MNKTTRTIFAVLVTIMVAATGVTLAHANQADDGGPWLLSGKVVETMNVASYTYLRVDTGTDKVWAAVPQLELRIGDQVKVPEGTLMTGYHSKSLDRSFENIHFVAFVVVDKKTKADPAEAANSDFDGIEKIEGGVTIGQIFDDKTDLVGKNIAVRGKVVKFSRKILGTNWLHLRDGSSGAQQGNDLTVTTSATVKVGDIVVVRGVLKLDKDFGAGYKYEVIVEDAEVTAE